MNDQTIIQGELSPEAREQLIALSVQLQMSEADVVGWALSRCGLSISFPNTLLGDERICLEPLPSSLL